jgi:hypothetical protein
VWVGVRSRPSIVAVIGTLAGSTVTYLFGQISSRGERIQRIQEASRQERLSAYSEFTGSVEEYRRKQRDRWHRREDSPADVAEAARQDAYRHRVLAYGALAKVQLTARPAVDDSVTEVARRAFEATESMPPFGTRNEMEAQCEVARVALDTFVRTAATIGTATIAQLPM